MRIFKYIIALFAISIFIGRESIAQTVPWTVITTTGFTHTIFLDATVNPSFNGSPISNGDAVGVFYNSGGNLICGGYGIWTASGLNIVAYGATGTTTNGFALNESFNIKYWSKANNCTSSWIDYYFVSSTSSPIVTAGNYFVNGGVSQFGGFTCSVGAISYNSNFYNTDKSICIDYPVTSTIIGFNPFKNGVFTNPTFSSVAGLSINSITGFIDPNTSNIGTYTITFFTESCLYSNSNTFSINPNPIFNLGNNTTVCASNFVLLSTSLSGTYLWSTGTTSSSVYVSTPGIYTLTVTDFNGCKSEDNIQISNFTTTSLSLGNDQTICPGSFATISTSIAGSYLWSTGSVTSSLVVSTPGIYTLTVTDFNGCKVMDSIQIYSSLPLFVQLGKDTIGCTSTPIVLDINTTGTGYLWSTGQITKSITVTTSGVYWGSVNASGCQGADTISVTFSNKPLVNLGNDISSCPGTSIVLASLYTASGYTWSTGDTTNLITVTSTGIYSLSANSNGCYASDTIQVNYLPYANFTLGKDTSICAGNKISLTPNITGTGYVWSNGLTTQSITVSTSGLYNLTLTSNFGCKSTDQILVSTSTISSFTIGKDTSVCLGSPIILKSSILGTNYLWSTGETSSQITVSTGGLYFLTIKSSQGCISSDTALVINKNIRLDQLLINITPAKCNQIGQISVNENTISNAAPPIQYSYKNTLTNATTPLITNYFDTKDGIYELTITDVKGCRATYPQNITVPKTEDCKNPILAPNSDGTLSSVFIPLPGIVKIYDKNGVLKKQFFAPNEWDGTDESGQVLPMGDYFLVSSESDKTLTITIIK